MHVRIVSEEMTKEYEVKTVSKPVPIPNTVVKPSSADGTAPYGVGE